VVGIGASAGGLQAFRPLLGDLPSTTGLAFVLIQHLDPTHQSSLSEILGRATIMPVREAADGVAVEPNHVYVIPPNAELTIADRVLKLSPRSQAAGLHMPIDVFLRSLAQDCRSSAIGVILSGAGSDGALGLKNLWGCKRAARTDIRYGPKTVSSNGCYPVYTPLHPVK
jgi:two-component system CheB/CheR fusion protein